MIWTSVSWKLTVATMPPAVSNADIKQWAYELGFDLVGIAPAQPIPHGDAFREYLSRQYHGSMTYLARHIEKRIDPRQLMPQARSVICTALNYYNPSPENPDPFFPKVARYAWGLDYHRIMKDNLKKLSQRIQVDTDHQVRTRCFVDTAPLAEKAHAARAGLGWIGKNTLLINERFGSWLVLGEILTDLELEYDQPVSGQCGSCRCCLDSCPTGALCDSHILDARRCISFLTIESREKIPSELADKIKPWFFGCDICQEACPFNKNTPTANSSEWKTIPGQTAVNIEKFKNWNQDQYRQYFQGSSLICANWEYLKQLFF